MSQERQIMEINSTRSRVQDQAKYLKIEGGLLEKNQEISNSASKISKIPAYLIRQYQIIHAKINAPLPQNDPT